MKKYEKYLNSKEWEFIPYNKDLPQASGGMAVMSGISNSVLADINTAKGFVDVFGNLKNNQAVNQFENQQLRQSIYSDAENQTMPQDYQFNRNPAYYANGGVMDYEDNVNPQVLTENKEVAQLPNGLIDTMHGDNHSDPSGGIAMNLPNYTKIFSEKLKMPDTKKSFASLVKKFETKKDIKNLDNASDKIAENTANLSILLKNKASDQLFQTQEKLKIGGVFGKSVQKEAINNTQMKFGGLTQYATKGKVDNHPPLAGTKGIGQDNFLGDLDAVYANAKGLGYKGAKDIASLQSWAKTKDPTTISNYMQMVKPNKKAEKIWKERYSTTAPVDLSAMTPDERVEAFNDGLWDFRFPKINQGAKPVPPVKAPLVSDSISQGASFQGTNSNSFKNPRGLGINLAIPSTYAKDPLSTSQLKPEFISPRYLDIQNQLNETTRQNNLVSMNSGDRGTSNIGNIFQGQINAYNQNQNTFGQKYQYDRQSDQNAQQFNAQSKMSTDQLNLNERNRFLDQIQRRNGLLQGQINEDNRGSIENMWKANQATQTYNYLDSVYPYSEAQGNYSPRVGINNNSLFSPDVTKHFKYDPITGKKIEETTDKKFGGKIRPKKKLKFTY